MNYFLLLSLVSVVHGLEINLNETTIFSNGKVHQSFNYSLDKDSCQSNINIYHEFKEIGLTEFIFIKKNESDTFTLLNLSSSNYITENTLKLNNLNQTHSILEIYHFCENQTYLDKFNSKWTEIKFNFMYNDKIFDLKFIKLCEDPKSSSVILSLLLIFIIATLFVSFSGFKNIKFDKVFIEQGEIKSWQGFIFIIVGSIMLILIFYFINYAIIILTCLVSIQSAIALFLTLRTFCDDMGLNKISTFLAKKLFFEITCQNLFISIISIIIVIIWLISKNWIFNNFLAFCIVFTILSVFHINTLKVCAIILGLTFIYDVFWVYVSSSLFEKNVMSTVAIQLNLPIKIEFPVILGNNPLRNCVILGLGDIVIPGLVVKFCKSFDIQMKTNIYYKYSIIFYIFGLLSCGFVLILFNYPQPALLFLCPSLIFGISIVSYKRGEFNKIWNGIEIKIQEFSSMNNNPDEINI